MHTWSVEDTVQRRAAANANSGTMDGTCMGTIGPAGMDAAGGRTFEEFVASVRALLEGTAAGKGYSPNGPNGQNPLYEFVAGVVGGPQHAIGETIYKLVRYQHKRNPEDLLKAACWAFLMWHHR